MRLTGYKLIAVLSTFFHGKRPRVMRGTEGSGGKKTGDNPTHKTAAHGSLSIINLTLFVMYLTITFLRECVLPILHVQKNRDKQRLVQDRLTAGICITNSFFVV